MASAEVRQPHDGQVRDDDTAIVSCSKEAGDGRAARHRRTT